MRVEFTVSETPESDYLIGLDIGTSMSKAALFDRRGREVSATGSRTRVRSPHPGWSEMEAEDLFAAAASADDNTARLWDAAAGRRSPSCAATTIGFATFGSSKV